MSLKTVNQSWIGALCAMIQRAGLEHFDGVLHVRPLAKGIDMLEYVQPEMSAGGHAIGAAIVSQISFENALCDGIETIKRLARGDQFQPIDPNHALRVLFAIAHTFDEKEAMATLRPLIKFSKNPQQQTNVCDIRPTFIVSARYLSERLLLESISDWSELKNWKDIKQKMPTGVCISNAHARRIFRILQDNLRKKINISAIKFHRNECFAPIAMSEHPIYAFIVNCWRLRPSSISMNLCKFPPVMVMRLLNLAGFGCGRVNREMLREEILTKFTHFRKWINLQFPSQETTPYEWSDTLSRFAKAINPSIAIYNKLMPENPFLHATSFVPKDLAPEMYRTCREDGYFYNGKGLYYEYSSLWRRDAVHALKQNRLPRCAVAILELDLKQLNTMCEYVTDEVALLGGSVLLEALAKVGVDPLVFTTFLRKYYTSGAFIDANLCL